MSRVETITVYSFEELSEDAKEVARDNARQWPDLWGWQDEWWGSAKAFGDIAPIEITQADYTYRQVETRWVGVGYALRYEHDDAIRELTGVRAWKWLENNGWFSWAEENAKGSCTMTGYCGDCPFGDAIAAYTRDPLNTPSIGDVFDEAAQAWVSAAADDLEHAYSSESIDDTLTANQFEFLEDGSLH